MKQRLAVISSLILLLVVTFIYITRSDDRASISVNAANAFISDSNQTSLHVFFNVANLGRADVLLSAHSAFANTVSIIRPKVFSDAITAIPAQSLPVFSSDSIFLELTGARTDLTAGDLVPVTLVFEKAGKVPFKAIVSEMDPSAMHHDMLAESSMDHKKHTEALVNTNLPTPQVNMSIEPSPEDDGWRLVVSTTDFTFVNAPAGTPHVHGEGHAHLYLNGLKLQRLYGEQASIGSLPPGTYTLSVTLNTNMHAAYTDKGNAVKAELSIVSD